MNRLEEINLEITKLQKEKTDIEQSIIDDPTVDFLTKFKTWYYNNNKCHKSWVIREEEFPLLRAKFNEQLDCVRRGKTYSLEDVIGEDDMYVLLESTPEDNISEEEYTEIYNEIQPMLEEAMRGKMKSFECDW
jgi:hypothetical protein